MNTDKVWAWQPFGPDETIYSFLLTGWHYRGFPVIHVTVEERAQIESGQPFTFRYKGFQYVAREGRVERE